MRVSTAAGWPEIRPCADPPLNSSAGIAGPPLHGCMSLRQPTVARTARVSRHAERWAGKAPATGRSRGVESYRRCGLPAAAAIPVAAAAATAAAGALLAAEAV